MCLHQRYQELFKMFDIRVFHSKAFQWEAPPKLDGTKGPHLEPNDFPYYSKSVIIEPSKIGNIFTKKEYFKITNCDIS